MEEERDLPPGIQEEDLRFVHPANFAPYMSWRGWSAEACFNVNGHPLKSRIMLARPVSPEFGVEEFEKLAVGMGIVDEETGDFKTGYKLQVDTFGEMGSVSRSVRRVLNPHEDDSRLLIFSFEGFSTQETMDALEVITSAFEEPEVVVRHTWIRRTLGKLSLNKKQGP